MKIKIKAKSKGEFNVMIGGLIMLMVGIVVLGAVVLPTIQAAITAGGTISRYERNATGPGTVLTGTVITFPYNNIIASTFTVDNVTDAAQRFLAGNYTLDAAAGKVTFLTVPTTINNTNITFYYYPATYIQNASAMSILRLLPLMLAVIILLVAVAMVKFKS